MSLVRLHNVCVDLGGRRVLDRIDLHVDAGEIVTIVGPNGSGKSTLLRAIIGAVPVASGRLIPEPGLSLGYVPQRLATGTAIPMTARRFLSLPRPAGRAAVARALADAGAEALADRPLRDLSGGQMQRVLLAQALMGAPRLLLLDEPTQSLDQPGAAAFYRRIEAVRDRTGAGILMVSHDLHVVMSASTRVVCLNGHVCCAGTPETVASAPEYRALFGAGTDGALALYRHHHDHGH